MDTHWWLSEGFGPRATGTPGYSAAADWAMKKFTEWGFKNVHIERFPFGQGWSIDRFSAHLLTPQAAPLVGMPRWYSPSTNGTVTSDVVHVKAANEADLAKYKGQLAGKIVILQAARPVRMLEDRIVLRMNDADWTEAMKLPAPRRRPPRPPAPASPALTPQQFAQLVQRFLVAEGAAVAARSRLATAISPPAAATCRGGRSASTAARSSRATAAAATPTRRSRCRRRRSRSSTTTAWSACSSTASRCAWK